MTSPRPEPSLSLAHIRLSSTAGSNPSSCPPFHARSHKPGSPPVDRRLSPSTRSSAWSSLCPQCALPRSASSSLLRSPQAPSPSGCGSSLSFTIPAIVHLPELQSPRSCLMSSNQPALSYPRSCRPAGRVCLPRPHRPAVGHTLGGHRADVHPKHPKGCDTRQDARCL